MHRRRSLIATVTALLALGLVASVPRGFDGRRAFRDLEALVRVGPRPAGSDGAAAAREIIEGRLRQAGWPVRRQELRVAGRDGLEIGMTNLIGVRRGQGPGRILIGTHYDTKDLSPLRFVGANDGASGVAVLLELARVLGALPGRHELWLVFFDGEEALGPAISASDGLFGSRALAAQMEEEGRLDSVRAFILIDMVGDRDLNLATDVGSDEEMRQIVAEEAARLGLESILDPKVVLGLVDDHTPFLERGVARVLALIDFQYGARSTPGPYWHTGADDLDAVSARSLNSVGRLLVEILERVEREIVAAEGADGT